jgi:hypothetical protein
MWFVSTGNSFLAYDGEGWTKIDLRGDKLWSSSRKLDENEAGMSIIRSSSRLVERTLMRAGLRCVDMPQGYYTMCAGRRRGPKSALRASHVQLWSDASRDSKVRSIFSMCEGGAIESEYINFPRCPRCPLCSLLWYTILLFLRNDMLEQL